jgi:hypothetical protein
MSEAKKPRPVLERGKKTATPPGARGGPECI